MKLPVAIGLFIGLAACTPAKSTPEASQVASSAEGAAISELAPAATLLPEDFIGVWDADMAACKAASDMKLTITQSELAFWESSGKITGVTVNGPDDVNVKASFSGEGEQWQREVHMILSDDVKALTVDGTTRIRCP